jgi:hypothetical protein
MKGFEVAGLLAALVAAGLIGVACLRRGSWGMLVPLGEAGGIPLVLFWSAAAMWFVAAIIAVGARRWWVPMLGGVAVIGAAAPSLLLIGACVTGDCL